MTEISAAVQEVILAFADDEHLMGQQHTEWIGVAPFLEEDLAFASIGQDELGHAAMLLELLVGDDDQAIDELAFYRPPSQWRSSPLVEVNLPEWSDTLVRHWLYDEAEELRWGLFARSSIPELAAIADRALSEERFHRRHADALVTALLATDEARGRLHESLAKLAGLARTLFDPVEGEHQAIADGVVTQSIANLEAEWMQRVHDRFGPVDWDAHPAVHSARTTRHGDFDALLTRMREVLDLDRAAIW